MKFRDVIDGANEQGVIGSDGEAVREAARVERGHV